MSSLRLNVLGRFEARLPSGEVLPLPTRKAEIMLTYLSMTPGQPHSRDRLMNLLWSDRSQDQARNSLRQTLSTLKKALDVIDPLPLQVDHSGVFLFGSDSGKARGMLLNHAAADIFWEDAFADAQTLSWYIVDAMPWLLPQHIRYVGQECASLMHAMRAKECYLQG